MAEKLIRICDICDVYSSKLVKAVAQYTSTLDRKTYDVCKEHLGELEAFGITTWNL